MQVKLVNLSIKEMYAKYFIISSLLCLDMFCATYNPPAICFENGSVQPATIMVEGLYKVNMNIYKHIYLFIKNKKTFMHIFAVCVPKELWKSAESR